MSTGYPPETPFVVHEDGQHPDTPVFRANCDICQPEPWDGIPADWLEEQEEGDE